MPPPSSSRFYQNIEDSAGFYGPDVYDLLRYYRNLETLPDELSAQLVPLTSVKKNPKIFAVGLLPPSATVTGKILDRSQSLARYLGSGDTGSATPSPTPSADPGDASSSSPDDARLNPQLLSPSFWDKYVQMCNRLGVDPLDLARVIYAESGWKSGAVNYQVDKKGNKVPVAKGYNQLIRSVGMRNVGMTGDQWDNLDQASPEEALGYTEKFFASGGGIKGRSPVQIYRKNFGGYNNPDGSLYASKAHQAAVGGTFTNPAYQQLAIEQNPGLAGDKGYITIGDLARVLPGSVPVYMGQAIADAQGRVGDSKGTIGDASQPATGDWAKAGQKNAQQSQQEADKIANKDLNQTGLGKRYQEAQRTTILQLQAAIAQIQNTPPLRLLVNPSSFKVAAEKIARDGEWGREGPIIHHWGDNQDKVEASGKVAAFFARDVRGPGPGLTRTARQFSESYKNLLSLYLIYRNNGGVYIDDTLGDSSSSRLTLVGSVYLYYDGILYVGKFESFTMNQTEESPYSLEYSFSFSCRYVFYLDRLADPRFTYGKSTQGAPVVSTNGLSPADEEAFYANLEQNRLEVEADLAKSRAERERNAATIAAQDKRDQEIGVFGTPPTGSFTPEERDYLAHLQNHPPPADASLTLPSPSQTKTNKGSGKGKK